MLTSLKINKAKSHLEKLKYIPQQADQVDFLLTSKEYKQRILDLISKAKSRVYITALYWEKDEAGQDILEALYQAKLANPQLDVKVLVDWHRAQRQRLGEEGSISNADWYYNTRRKYGCDLETGIPFFGVPINVREVFGVLHLKGFVFDDTLLYSGSSLNNVYLHQFERYRCDRYHAIENKALADSIVDFTNNHILKDEAVNRLDKQERPATPIIRPLIKAFRKNLSGKQYKFKGQKPNGELSVSLLMGLTKKRNKLNKTIEALFCLVDKKLTICTPYFNFPRTLRNRISWLLKAGKEIEIIVGDKTANDFYSKPEEKFRMSSGLPYLYEQNLRAFCRRYKRYIDNGQLKIRIWKDGENSYHMKGVWIDNRYMLLTGNNLNPRAWRLDAENGVLIDDPKAELEQRANQELAHIRTHTTVLSHFSELETKRQYPKEACRLLKRFERVKLDKVVKILL